MSMFKLFKVSAIALFTLGVIHVCATPVILYSLRQLPLSYLMVFAFMYVATGLSFVFIGWLQCFCIKHREESICLVKILKASCIFVLICGIGAVVTMFDNPFAYLTLFIALFQFVMLKKIIS
jgi:hypothetical protein